MSSTTTSSERTIRSTTFPQRLVDAGDHGRQRPVPGREDDPGPRPGQPGAPQERLAAADPGTLAPIELEPHAGLRDPRPVHPPVAGGVRLLGSSDRAAGRPLRALEAQRQELVVDDVGPDLALRALDPLLDLGQEAVDQPLPRGPLGQDAAGGAQPDVSRNRVVRAAGELRRPPPLRLTGSVVAP